MAELDSSINIATWSLEKLRLITKIAVLAHEEGQSQSAIAKKLNLSNARVSRYMKAAEDAGIVRTVVVQPKGIYVGLEKALEQKFGLREVVIVEKVENSSLITALGSAAATYLETTLEVSDCIGISTWSSTLLATVEAMRSRPRKVVRDVVQLIGGVGSPQAQLSASFLVGHLAALTSATPHFIAAPGVASSIEAKQAFLGEPSVSATMEAWKKITTMLVGIGAFRASPLLAASGNALSAEEEMQLEKTGAVGEICLRYFDEMGKAMKPSIENKVISIDAAAMRQIPRRIAVAGGPHKIAAIRGALSGGWVNILITDSDTARQLLEPPGMSGGEKS